MKWREPPNGSTAGERQAKMAPPLGRLKTGPPWKRMGNGSVRPDSPPIASCRRAPPGPKPRLAVAAWVLRQGRRNASRRTSTPRLRHASTRRERRHLDLRELLGHASIRTTQRYTQVDVERSTGNSSPIPSARLRRRPRQWRLLNKFGTRGVSKLLTRPAGAEGRDLRLRLRERLPCGSAAISRTSGATTDRSSSFRCGWSHPSRSGL